jgi:hypothetical protein
MHRLSFLFLNYLGAVSDIQQRPTWCYTHRCSDVTGHAALRRMVVFEVAFEPALIAAWTKATVI